MVRLILCLLVVGAWGTCLASAAMVVNLSCYHPPLGRAGSPVLGVICFVALLVALVATQELMDYERKQCPTRPNDEEDDEWKPNR